MRKLIMFLTLAVALMVIPVSGVMAAGPHPGLTLMGGAYTFEDSGDMKLGDEFGFGGGLLVRVNSHLGFMGMYDGMKLDDVTVYTLSTYGVATLFGWNGGAVSGIGGLEWEDTEFAKLNLGDPDVSWGLMARVNTTSGFGAYVVGTNTMADDTQLLDIVKVRGGVSYTF